MSTRLPSRLTVADFAFCLEVCPEVARRYLRANKCGIVSKRLAVRTGRDWKIRIEALPLFGVTTELAAARLDVFHETQSPVSSPSQA